MKHKAPSSPPDGNIPLPYTVVKQLVEDGRRYRWIRNNLPRLEQIGFVNDSSHDDLGYHLHGATLDAAIDAEIKEVEECKAK